MCRKFALTTITSIKSDHGNTGLFLILDKSLQRSTISSFAIIIPMTKENCERIKSISAFTKKRHRFYLNSFQNNIFNTKCTSIKYK